MFLLPAPVLLPPILVGVLLLIAEVGWKLPVKLQGTMRPHGTGGGGGL
jgi:hypothetical protein